jgi:hypothetical protein
MESPMSFFDVIKVYPAIFSSHPFTATLFTVLSLLSIYAFAKFVYKDIKYPPARKDGLHEFVGISMLLAHSVSIILLIPLLTTAGGGSWSRVPLAVLVCLILYLILFFFGTLIIAVAGMFILFIGFFAYGLLIKAPIMLGGWLFKFISQWGNHSNPA